MLDVNQKFIRCSCIIIKKMGDMCFALDTNTGSEYKINEVSYDMLEMLSEPISLSEIIDKMMDTYDVSKERVRQDCENWIEFALSHKIIENSN